ncbi:MAG: nucleotide exchange factor GrpE [Chloroflexi bacterium]|nr:nucleotide exchange factor GrpE [Chloroflexota bacterium]
MNDEDQQPDAQAEPGPPPAEAERPEPDDIDGLRARLAEEKERAGQYMASWQRAAADFQNQKRRVEQERAEVGRLANMALVINLLSLMDDLDRALRTVDAKLAGLTWIDGIRLISRKFEAALQNAGVKEIPADGEAFNPQVHEAISEAEGDEGKVISVVQKGYTLGERVIRPAMVIVGKAGGGGAPDGADEKAPEAESDSEA